LISNKGDKKIVEQKYVNEVLGAIGEKVVSSTKDLDFEAAKAFADIGLLIKNFNHLNMPKFPETIDLKNEDHINLNLPVSNLQLALEDLLPKQESTPVKKTSRQRTSTKRKPRRNMVFGVSELETENFIIACLQKTNGKGMGNEIADTFGEHYKSQFTEDDLSISEFPDNNGKSLTRRIMWRQRFFYVVSSMRKRNIIVSSTPNFYVLHEDYLLSKV
jgi:hypothetical protein